MILINMTQLSKWRCQFANLQEKVFGAVVLDRCCVLHTTGVHLLHSFSESVLVQHTKVHQVRPPLDVDVNIQAVLSHTCPD